VKYILVAIASLFVGYYLYPAFNAIPQPKQHIQPFKNFIEKEAKKYADLQDADAKLKAADEMYGKMMMLFLAELGLMASASRPVTNQICPPVETKTPDESAVLSEKPKSEISVASVADSEVTSVSKKEEASKNDGEPWVKFASTPYIEKSEKKFKETPWFP
jgi:hypothetical protein